MKWQHTYRVDNFTIKHFIYNNYVDMFGVEREREFVIIFEIYFERYTNLYLDDAGNVLSPMEIAWNTHT